MRNTLLIVASLALGTGALAQSSTPAGPETSTQTPAQTGSTPTESSAGSPTSVPSDSPSQPSGSMSSGSMSNGSGGSMSSGGMSSGNMGQAQQMAASTDTSNFPKCSRTVTDKCVQAGGGMGTMHGRTMHKKSMRKPH